MDFDMEQHEVVFNCAKRAIEQALFNYTLSPNEVYDAALTYTRDEEKRTASTAAIKNSYAKTLMKAMNYFCIEPFEKLNLNNLIGLTVGLAHHKAFVIGRNAALEAT